MLRNLLTSAVVQIGDSELDRLLVTAVNSLRVQGRQSTDVLGSSKSDDMAIELFADVGGQVIDVTVDGPVAAIDRFISAVYALLPGVTAYRNFETRATVSVPVADVFSPDVMIGPQHITRHEDLTQSVTHGTLISGYCGQVFLVRTTSRPETCHQCLAVEVVVRQLLKAAS
jgi:hypothetical protein